MQKHNKTLHRNFATLGEVPDAMHPMLAEFITCLFDMVSIADQIKGIGVK